jgi:3-phosphoinositide dependent protein kinase-1
MTSTNENLKNSSLQDLSNDLESIYNTYAIKSGDQSDNTLDSDTDRASPYRNHNQAHSGNDSTYDKNLPEIHVSSRLSSLKLEDGVSGFKSAPVTPSSASSFDFTVNPRHHPALTNSSLNVLLDNHNDSDEFKHLVGSNMSDDEDPEDRIPLSEEARKDKEEWQLKGAAVRKVSSDSMYRIIKRTVKDFKFGKDLGEGSYSTVVLATDIHTSKQYAVKILDKRHIIKEKKVKYVNIEKHALNRLSNRMGIISLYFTFQDKASLYFVLDYASNGELLGLIKKYNTLNEDCVRHFGAQILDAIKYMHDNGVIHRDIKPENILLDDKSRIQITDFGTARLLEKKNDTNEEYPVDVRAKSFVGTAEYVSPELLESKYCGKPGDIWAFGCIIYQMIAGKPPFKAANEYLTFQKITKLQYAFSAGFPIIIRDLLKQILVLQPSKRATIPQIQQHYFFQSVDFKDFDQIWSKEPPEIGPYKMNAKAMMKVPEMTKSHSQPQITTRKVYKKVQNGSGELPSKRTTSEGNGKLLNPASVAAFVLNKKEANSSDDDISGVSESEVSKTSSSSSTPTTTRVPSSPGPEYIPGTNILRPQINTRASYARTSLNQKKAAKAKPKFRVMEVTRLGPLELTWGKHLKHADERVLRIAPVIVHREPTEWFEKKNRGSLHNAPLNMVNKLQATNASRGGSLLSQVVNGNTTGLRGSMTAVESLMEIEGGEADAIIDYFEIEEFEESEETPEPADSSHNGTSGSRYSSASLWKKLRLTHDKNKELSNHETDTISSGRRNPLEKPRTCTAVVTTHGRVLIFLRGELESNYRLISEIKLNYPFIQFKEVISSVGKLQKLLPTTGIFGIESTNTTFVFEVEKYEVSQWTDALAKSKLNQYERMRVVEHQSRTPVKPASPKLLDSPQFSRAIRASGGNDVPPHSPKQNDVSQRVSSDSGKHTPMMSSKLKIKHTRRKAPPPLSSPNGINMSTGFSNHLGSNESDMLQAAQLAVAHNSHIPMTQNRRSSFTKDSGASRQASNGTPTNTRASLVITGVITSKTSKFLARTRNK